MATLSKQQIKDLFAKSRQAQEKGRLDEAERGYKKLLKAAPQLAEVSFNLAEIFTLRGKVAEAAERFEHAVKLRPNEPAIWVSYLNMASRHPNQKNFDVLRERARPVLGKTPAFAFFEGLAALREENWEAAAKFLKSAIDAGFRQARVYAEYGSALVGLKKFDLAMSQFDMGLTLAPDSDMVLFRKAGLLQSMGRIDEARDAIQRAIKLAPNVGGHHALYASLTKMTADDPNIPVMKAALKSKRVGDKELPALGYALAKAMEDSGQFGKVFTYLNLANRALAKAYPYDVPSVIASAERICRLFERVKDFDGPVSDASPIFVTGAPRSGTTLVEQILASHSQIEGGGEIGFVQPKFADLIVPADKDWGADGQELMAQCVKAADEFGVELKKMFPDAPFVTDKSISSYAILGFLAKAMPNARFVVVRRDPRDNALSIYKNQFREGLHRYANNLEHIAIFLRQFEEMVEFWRQHLPGSFHEIRYEELIAEPEAQSRALIAATGFEWEDACLSFYETKREVRTLSATQVRQPMYSSSVGAWKKFETDMKPFLTAFASSEASDT
ncbi:Tetratricopeptide repeat-containing protein [Litoreibacter ascidiaceicola]|uniref:Tetratricopeptide repeat-containing protein n=1 Tax=Litoreibacter ascidiaceicola TaxID=1486859 RepID=A0A1M4ZEL2_9RHOB|nr:sulfotransferase [Litoreibacter ascidiaceicola]SHF16431.1 Tetratricopeptide repeat-containing protein [Litoreibacter ascidiaceicola]